MVKEKHNYQWDSTENALSYFSELVKKGKDDPDKFFLETSCFATEKFDGTNLAKDDLGQIYSRKYMLEHGEEEFIKTSLRKVKEADVVGFKNILIEAAGLNPNVVTRCVVYGEFICNPIYNYQERGIIGDWKVFGAKLEVTEGESIGTLAKLAESGFAFQKRSINPNHVKVYSNEKFFDLAKQANLDVPEYKGENVSLAKIIAMNKDDMKRGLLEGLIITIYQEESGYRFIKWKGSQEFQPMPHGNFLKANDVIQISEAHDEVKKAFLDVREVIMDITQNESALKLVKNTKSSSLKENPNKRKKGHLTELDQDIITHGFIHAQWKFDSLEVYKKRGEKALEDYNECLIQEVKEHLDK